MGSGLDEHQVRMATEYIPAPSLAEAVDEHGPLGAAAAWRLTAETSSITTTGHFVGTAAYMSPEQARGKPVTTASDVFSVGCTLAYAVAARAPFGDGTGNATEGLRSGSLITACGTREGPWCSGFGA